MSKEQIQIESLKQIIESQKQTFDALMKKYEALNRQPDSVNWDELEKEFRASWVEMKTGTERIESNMIFNWFKQKLEGKSLGDGGKSLEGLCPYFLKIS